MSDENRSHTTVTDEFCVWRRDGRHPAYSVRSTEAEARAAIDWDGHPGPSVARRTRTVTTTAWRPVHTDAALPKTPADRVLRLKTLEGLSVSFGRDYELASDMVTLVYDGPELLGWADDYGSVSHPHHELEPSIKAAAERLVAVAGEVLALLAEASD